MSIDDPVKISLGLALARYRTAEISSVELTCENYSQLLHRRFGQSQ